MVARNIFRSSPRGSNTEPEGLISKYKSVLCQHGGEKQPIFRWITCLKGNIRTANNRLLRIPCETEKEQRGAHMCELECASVCSHTRRNDFRLESKVWWRQMTQSRAQWQNSEFYPWRYPNGLLSNLQHSGSKGLEQMHCLCQKDNKSWKTLSRVSWRWAQLSSCGRNEPNKRLHVGQKHVSEINT